MPCVDNKFIIEYVDFLTYEMVVPNGMFGAFASWTYYTVDAITKAKRESLYNLKRNAVNVGANAIVGIDFAIADLDSRGVLVSGNGTAVKVEKIKK